MSAQESEANESVREAATAAVESPDGRWVLGITDRLEPFAKPIDMPNDPERDDPEPTREALARSCQIRLEPCREKSGACDPNCPGW